MIAQKHQPVIRTTPISVESRHLSVMRQAYTIQGGMVTAITVNMLAHGTNTTEQITMKLVTPIPQADFLKQKGAPYRVYPVNVEAKKP